MIGDEDNKGRPVHYILTDLEEQELLTIKNLILEGW